MKNLIRLLGLIAIIAIPFFACASNGTDNTAPNLSGTITITSGGDAITAPVAINTPLTAGYSGEMETFSFQWNRYEVAIAGATDATYTPAISGKYTVTVNAEGYQSITSNGITVSEPFSGSTATELVAGMTVGWNLGNTMDADGGETSWGNPKTTKANITALKNAGFNTIRIPVSWHNGTNSSYNIGPVWMGRVKEIVDYAVDNDMYIILNTHHDEGIFKFTNKDAEKSKKAFKKIWGQIAETFKDYDEKLIFEGLNEPRTKASANEWNGGTAEERNNLNAHYEIFVDAVRASGGNNSKRILMVNPYGASGTQAAMAGLELPVDIMENKLIVSYHAYEPYNFALNTTGTGKWDKNNPADTAPIVERLDRAYNLFISKGIPVVLGEFGAMNKSNVAVRAAWAEYYVGYAKSKGIPCVWWDNGVTSGDGEKFGLLNRSSNTFTYPEIVAALMKSAAGK